MQRFNLIIGIILIFLVAFFCCETVFVKTIVLSFTIIILFISGCLYKLKFTVTLFGLVLFLLFVSAFFGVEILNISILIFGFSIAILTSHFFKESFEKYLKNFESNLKNLNTKFSKLKNENLGVLQKNKKLEVKVGEIEDLYEITKDMGVALEFEKIFKILQNIIRKRFDFKKCTLICMEKTEGAVNKITKILRIFQGTSEEENREGKTDGTFPSGESGKSIPVDKMPPPGESGKPTPADKALFEYFLKQTKPLLLKENYGSSLREKFNLPVSAKTFIAIPLIVEKQLIGILSMENSKEEDFEKFNIVAGQFALEMKKATLYGKVQELALTDGLTKLFVRRHFLKRLREEIERSKRHKLPLTLLMADIDHFKKCNDTYGHLVGDVVLKKVGDIIRDNIREVDLAGRYGGEEFCVALPESDMEGARHVAERIRLATEREKIRAYDENIQTTISIGLSLYPKDSKGIKGLIDTADKALYKAKNTGRNRVCVYEK